MTRHEGFWQLEALSDQEVLQALDGVICSGRVALATLLAHLAEVEERRLHLRAAFPSLFSYCVTRLGFSEDEACRRIEVARLARKCPALFPLLASGALSLSVVALLKPFLSPVNCAELLAAVAGKTVQQAREVLAARFPQPDVPSRVRKLPERGPRKPLGCAPASVGESATIENFGISNSDELPVGSGPAFGVTAVAATAVAATAVAATAVAATAVPATAVPATAVPVARATPISFALRPRTPPQRIAPLASARYKVEFTADAELKAKLDLARDLMRHANPSGDFAPLVARALDLLIADIQKRRFGACSTGVASGAATAAAETDASPAATDSSDATSSSHLSRATRRRVAQRAGLRCSWTDESGRRCNSQAWLEHDHQVPRGKGGGSEVSNVRLLCRSHNRLEAERQFGREQVDGAIAHARRVRQRDIERERNGGIDSGTQTPATNRRARHGLAREEAAPQG